MMKIRILVAGISIGLSVATQAGTVAHWDFNDPSLGASDGAALPDSDALTVWRTAALDQSGNGNHLTTWEYDWAGFNWTADSYQGDLGMVAAGSFPAAMTWSAQSSPGGVDVETISPLQWTVEAIFKCDDPTTYRTIVGRDGTGVATGNADRAPFYLSERAGGIVAVQFVDNDGNTHLAESAGGRIADGTWYHAAAVSDGSSLILYLKNLDADTEHQIVATANLSGSANASLAVGGGSSASWNAGSWTLARGLYAGGHEDRFFGIVDEVAISTDVLAPGSFICHAGSPPEIPGPRLMEKLNRGVVAASKGGSRVYIGWRMFSTDPENIGFNVYRNGTKINGSPITSSCNYVDASGSLSATYRVAAVIGGIEQEQSDPVAVWSTKYVGSGQYAALGYMDIPLQRPEGGTTPDAVDYTYSPNDVSVGDLDGDGELEIVLKWDPSNSKDNSHSGYSGNQILDAYEMDGTHLWRIDLGINIRAGAHYTQFMVYDLDCDGRAEVVCKTADGTVDGEGTMLGSATADYRTSAGYILSGPEYLSAFDGETGAFIDTVDYVPARGSVSSWGDDYGNRVDRFLACVACLDGERPSVVMCRGYYTRTVLAAWDLVDGQLVQRWVFDSSDSGNATYAGQGNHNLSVADVDGDGKDEIIYGSCTIDHDGRGLYSTGLGHGDALHVGDMDPDRPGLELWMPHETAASGATYRDAGTGEVIWEHENSGDVGRAVAAHIDSRYPGSQLWSYAKGGVYNTDGSAIADAGYSSYMMSFLVWWTGNLQREFLASAGSGGSPVIERWTGSGSTRYLSLYSIPTDWSTAMINGTKANPCLSGDILGDWREEMIFPSSDKTKLRIFTSTDVTTHRIYTLLNDPQYRLALAWQNVGYNQPPHPSFYIGEGMDTPPVPNIEFIEPVVGPDSGFVARDGVLSMEAEDGNLGLRWNIGEDGGASGGKYLEVDPMYNHTGASPAGTSDVYLASYPFTILSSGDYGFWYRILSDNADDDSFFWRIDDGIWNLENNRNGIGSWYSTQNAQVDGLTVGSHVLQVAYRENGTRIDKFVIQLDALSEPSGAGPAESAVDTDGDGLADDWEIDNFGTLGQAGSGDPDGDGDDNASEQANGTPPTISAIPPMINLSANAGVLSLNWSSNHTGWRLLQSTNLMTNVWTEVFGSDLTNAVGIPMYGLPSQKLYYRLVYP